MTNIYFESVLMAWSSIVSNKMRSLLTMLGIIIGVAAVIALMSIGYGVQDSIKSDISRLGSNTITVTPGTGRKPGVKQAAGSMQTLTYKGDNRQWRPEHISRYLDALRRWHYNRTGSKTVRYAWVAELQARGVIHYHVIV